MALSFKNYASVKGAKQGVILTGSNKSTIIKSLQIINGDQSNTINIIRKDNNNIEYANVRVDLKANDYLLLWQGFFVIPYGHTLSYISNTDKCTVIANVVQLT